MRILLALPVLAAGALAQPASANPLPDRPAIALARYKESWTPIVGFEAGSPVALDSGGKVTLPAAAGILLSVGDRFADGFVTISDRRTTDVAQTADPDMAEDPTMNARLGTELYEATLTSDTDLPAAYAILVTPAPPQADAQPRMAALVRPIGHLEAGKPALLSVQVPKLGQEGGPDWTVLVYSAGREVRSTGMGEVMAPYFDRIETAALDKRIADRNGRGANEPLAVFREMPLGLPKDVEAKYRGSTVKVKVEVDARGRVVSAKPEGVDDPELSQAVEKGFGAWLFLPPERNGAPAAGSAIVPLRL